MLYTIEYNWTEQELTLQLAAFNESSKLSTPIDNWKYEKLTFKLAFPREPWHGLQDRHQTEAILVKSSDEYQNQQLLRCWIACHHLFLCQWFKLSLVSESAQLSFACLTSLLHTQQPAFAEQSCDHHQHPTTTSNCKWVSKWKPEILSVFHWNHREVFAHRVQKGCSGYLLSQSWKNVGNQYRTPFCLERYSQC